jgi:hypothetical protein
VPHHRPAAGVNRRRRCQRPDVDLPPLSEKMRGISGRSLN